MRIEASVTSVSWIPSYAIGQLIVKLPFQFRVTQYDRPPPDVLGNLEAWRASNYFRFANELRAWIEVDRGKVNGFGYLGRGHIGATKLRLGSRHAAIRGFALPDLQHDPDVTDTSVRFTQTAGGRTGLPAPRRVSRAPFMQIAAPLAWTTLALTIHADGSTESELEGASLFPRHWIYGDDGQLSYKTGVMDFSKWYREAFGRHTPWGSEDSPALMMKVESALERDLSDRLMRDNQSPRVRKLKENEALVKQGAHGNDLFLLLDGVLVVEVDGEPLYEIAPGAILGERAILEQGTRTSTLRALTPCRVAVVSEGQISRNALGEVAVEHRREDQQSVSSKRKGAEAHVYIKE